VVAISYRLQEGEPVVASLLQPVARVAVVQ
jgi:hypothetical protein